MKKRELIKIPDNIVTTFFIFVFFSSAFIIKMGNKEAERYIRATTATEIPMTQITGDEGYGHLNGTIFYDINRYISSSSELIGNDPLSKDLWYNGRRKNKPNRYILFDLKLPYSLYKEKDNDTIIVIKDGFELKFLLESYN
ncbi:MAG: hypothetical protein J6W61_03235 [Bacteroidales bacterium]|nr:hypothetical protein [Bacteroidales bacterium]